ncbi:JDVT-CTERM system glutamic-type intramembrane protease [Reinekea blandensis]|uniref:CAAX prenyl protease 2/Lysostaphin resistance protein A-like domain-containing protein n=1 Tax=Reinekea blandensis MED297 TaxID=314283 RepID=A4BJ47_9GAMM|nr:JDVT-CTERM system glutamic-type intramembrane protease [Reinekea blandensis]EAR07892.1 hypothetical protein MED297_08731 [Reinekea sp. MED297] [Reinekea blandensis MED297]
MMFSRQVERLQVRQTLLYLSPLSGLFLPLQSLYGTLPKPSGADWVWFLMLIPLLEETVFRGLIQQSLTRKLAINQGALVANLSASLLFAWLHGFHQGPVGWLVFFPSLILGQVWQHTRSILICTGLHATMNLCFWLNLALLGNQIH